jgi:hypothetical protein
MHNYKYYAIAIILGNIGGLITMAFHPTGADLMNKPADVARQNELIAAAVHALAIISLPVLFFGLVGFCRKLGRESPIHLLGLITYGLGQVAVMSAAVISGFVGPALTRRIPEADDATKNILYALLMNNHQINQGFSKVYVVAAGTAAVLWSIGLLRHGTLMKAIAVLGFIFGSASILGVFSGHLKLDVHGFGAFILAQAIWLILAAIFTMNTEAEPASEANQ